MPFKNQSSLEPETAVEALQNQPRVLLRSAVLGACCFWYTDKRRTNILVELIGINSILASTHHPLCSLDDLIRPHRHAHRNCQTNLFRPLKIKDELIQTWSPAVPA